LVLKVHVQVKPNKIFSLALVLTGNNILLLFTISAPETKLMSSLHGRTDYTKYLNI